MLANNLQGTPTREVVQNGPAIIVDMFGMRIPTYAIQAKGYWGTGHLTPANVGATVHAPYHRATKDRPRHTDIPKG